MKQALTCLVAILLSVMMEASARGIHSVPCLIAYSVCDHVSQIAWSAGGKYARVVENSHLMVVSKMTVATV